DDLNCSNRPVRTRMPGGVGGAEPIGSPLSRLERQKILLSQFGVTIAEAVKLVSDTGGELPH
ncbi:MULTISPECIES: hypothetical protein, partial [unclassified Neorhizobium]|uniref:hypothetical protein n=1 Tax=unclassified Neorhizobium TaxID=2629175 RepID=UPI00104A47B0